jgi:hypothetical protein
VIEEQFENKYESDISAIASLVEGEEWKGAGFERAGNEPSTAESADSPKAEGGRETVEFADTVTLHSALQPIRPPFVHLINVVVEHGTKGGKKKMVPVQVASPAGCPLASTTGTFGDKKR